MFFEVDQSIFPTLWTGPRCIHQFAFVLLAEHFRSEERGREVTLPGACQITHALSPSLCICTPVCVSLCVVVNCSDPGIPANSIRQSKIEYGNFTFGTVVFFDCNPGFYLFGSPVLTCQPTGQWDKPLPECIGQSKPLR